VFNNDRVDDIEIFSLAQLKGWLEIKNHRQSGITLTYP